MSDRVAIIGGSTIGRDHFPFFAIDVSTTPTGDATIYPFAIDLTKLCLCFYVVKKWRIKFSYTFHEVGFGTHFSGNVQFDFQDWIRDEPDLVWRAATREAEWVVLPHSDQDLQIETSGSGFVYLGDPSDGSPEVSNFSTDRPTDDNLFFVGLNFISKWDAGNFRPFCYVHGGAGDQEFGSDSIGGGRAVGTLTLRTPPTGTFVTDIYAIDDDTSPGADNPLEFMNVEIHPVEFWAYAAKDSTPIYDTSTGAQLQSPFN